MSENSESDRTAPAAEELRCTRRAQRLVRELREEAGTVKTSVWAWLGDTASELSEWSNGRHPLAKALWTANKLIMDYTHDNDHLKELKAWPGMPKLSQTSNCLRQLSELLQYLLDSVYEDDDGIAAQMLLSALANVWDRVGAEGPPVFD